MTTGFSQKGRTHREDIPKYCGEILHICSRKRKRAAATEPVQHTFRQHLSVFLLPATTGIPFQQQYLASLSENYATSVIGSTAASSRGLHC